MHCQRHRPEVGAGEHHHGVLGRYAARVGDEFGLAGIGKTDFGEQRLGDRAGDDTAGLAGRGECGSAFQRFERQPGAVGIGLAGQVGRVEIAKNRNGPPECGHRFGGVRHAFDGNGEFASLCRLGQ